MNDATAAPEPSAAAPAASKGDLFNAPGPTDSPATAETATGEYSGGEAAASTEAPKDRLSDRFALLARKERQAVEREQRAKAKEESVKAQEAKIRAYDDALGNLKTNPRKTLKDLGVDGEAVYRLWTEQLLQGNEEDDPKAQVAALAAQVVKMQEREKEKETAQAKQAEATQVYQIKQQMKGFLRSEPDTYELINQAMASGTLDPTEIMYEGARVRYEATKGREVLTFKEAADKLEERLQVEALANAKTKKIQRQLGSAVNSVPAERQIPRTLTNSQAAPQSGRVELTKPASREQRLAASVQFLRDLNRRTAK